jgi:4'-phosphopantetheinyl transferase
MPAATVCCNACRDMTPPPLPLADDEIHLWLVADRTLRDPALLNRYFPLLNDAERRQQQRFHFDKDRHQYLLTRALVRSVLSRYVPAIPPTEWCFEKLEHGRPRITNPHPLAQRLTFNLSHTAGLIVLGLCQAGDMGIDTENIRERSAPLDVSPRYFSPRECADLNALPAAAQNERFFHYWTLKEAYIKARSKGLSLPLDQFSYTWPDEHRLQLTFASGLADHPERWRCWLLQATADHLLAIWAQRQPAPQKLLTRALIPLQNDWPLNLPVLRQQD